MNNNTPNPETGDPGMTGFPETGDPYVEGDARPPAPPTPPAPPAPQADPNADLRARMDKLERENENLKRLIPPATPSSPTPNNKPVSAIDSIDWDKELFADPKGTIAKAISIAKEEATRELRTEYKKDQGTTKFWDTFYRAHPDLRDDHDLVELTLNSNIAALANIPVEDAYNKLAELTRERIIRYAGGAARRTKARAEGGGSTPAAPTPTPPPQPAHPSSLSSIIRARREKRRAGAV